MNPALAFIPEDRRHALATGAQLPLYQEGTVLFVDVSGSSRLTDALIASMGTTNAIDHLTTLFNRCFAALMTQIHQLNGAVITFGGDGFIAVFADDDGVRALTTAFLMQKAMEAFRHYALPDEQTVMLALKITVAQGPFLRLSVGDPEIQRLEVVLGAAVTAASQLQKIVQAGQVVIDGGLAAHFGEQLEIEGEPETQPTALGSVVVTGWQPHSPPIIVADRAHTWSIDHVTLDSVPMQEWLAAPVYERLGQSTIDFLAEIRPVTVLFLHFTGLPLQAKSASDAVAVQQMLDRYVQWVQQVLGRHEGFLLKLTFDDKGSYALITFGAPRSAYADTTRALTAALALIASPSLHPSITEVKIGLNRGRILAGAFGGETRAAYDLLGSAVNWGSRYMMVASPGEILLAEAVAIDGGESFQLRRWGEHHFPGMQEAVTLYQLLGHQPTEFALPDRVVARQQELHSLHHWSQRVRDGQGQIVIMEGPAGIGKSHLVGTFVREVTTHGARAAVGTCDYVGTQIPYYPWRTLVRQLLTHEQGLQERLSVVQKQLLIEFLGEQLSGARDTVDGVEMQTLYTPERRQEAIFTLISTIVTSCAANHPLVLVIEDLYFCDPISLDLLRVISRLIPEQPILLLLVQHPTAAEKNLPLVELREQPYFHMMSIGELAPDAIATIVTDRLMGNVEPLVIDLIHSQSQGNPLHAEEFALALRDLARLEYLPERAEYRLNSHLLATLRAANCLMRDGESGAWRLRPNVQFSATELGLPDILHGLVNIRVDQVPETLIITLYTAALMGQQFSLSLLTAAHIHKLAKEQIAAQLAQLEMHALLVRTDIERQTNLYTFRHNLVQKVIYEKVPAHQKEILHRHIGEALERIQPEAVEELAFHFTRTDQDAKALSYLEQAAHNSRAEFANEAALNFYEQALRYEQRLEWLVAKVELLHTLGNRDAEGLLLEQLAPHAERLSFTYPYLCAQHDEATGAYEPAQYFAEQALQMATDRSDITPIAQSRLLLGLIARRQGDYDGAIQFYQQGIDLLSSHTFESADNATAVVALYSGLSNVLRQQGKYAQARALCRQALMLCQRWENRRGEADVMNTLGGIAYYLREFAAARDHHQRALQIRRTTGELRGEAISLYGLAVLDYEMGKFDQARQLLQQATAILRVVRDLWEEANAVNVLGVIQYQLGDFPNAHESFVRCIQLGEEVDDPIGQGYALCNLGLVLRDEGKLSAAERHFLESIQIAEGKEERHLLAMGMSHLAILFLRKNQREEAIRLATLAVQIREDLGTRELTTIDLTTLALAYQQLDQPARARQLIEQALALLTECQGEGPEFPHWDYYHCYVILLWLGDEERAVAALRVAYTMLMARADAIHEPATRSRFLNTVLLNRQICAAAQKHGLRR